MNSFGHRHVLQNSLKISADGYRQFYRKYKSLLYCLDVRITDENKLIFASVDFLQRLRYRVEEYIVEDTDEDVDKTKAVKIAKFEMYDDKQILEEEDPYKSIIWVLDAILELNTIEEKQPGLRQIKQRFLTV